MSRAANGDGSIRSRTTKSGTVYDVQVSVKDANTGMSKRLTKGGFRTKKEAQTWRNRIMAESEAGKLVAAKPLTVPVLLERWLDRGEAIAPSSERLYRGVLNNHIRKHLNVRADKLSPQVMQTYFSKVATNLPKHAQGGRGVMRTSLTMVRAACRWAARSDVGILARNPLAGATVTLPVTEKKRKSVPTEGYKRLLEVSKGTDAHLLWLLLGSSGMRQGEATALTWGDVDLNAGKISITKINAPEKSGTVVKRVKAGSARVVPISGKVKAQLAKRRLEVGGSDTEFIFPSSRAPGPIRSTAIHKWWVRDMELAGLEGYQIHSLRHTAATLMLEAGVPVIVVSKILGHSTPSTTINIYGHSTETQEVSAIAAIADAIA
jgi:integrase